jgi:hypothetical protein
MWVTGDPALYRRALSLSDQGRDPDTRDHRIEHVGLKAKMGALPAAFGLAQLERIDELLARKREAFGWYRERLADRPGLRLNPEPPGVDPSYWMATATFDPSLGLSKESVIAYLGERGIECRPFFCPLSSMPAFVGPSTAAARAENRVAYEGFDAFRFFPWLDETRPTWFTAVPTMHQLVLRRAAAHADVIERSRLRLLRSSSASMPLAVLEEAERVFGVPLIEAYGMTEASHQMTVNPLPPRVRKPGSVGPPTSVEVRILDAEGGPCRRATAPRSPSAAPG